jgi:rubrerythrin
MNETELYIKQLENENKELKEKLKNYTAPKRSKTFYENHKEYVLQKNKEYKEKTNYYANLSPEKKKEYAKRAYLNKKEKLKNSNENVINENI